MGSTIAFVSIKGGVGKTMVALETASSLANKFNKRVLLVDANFSAPNVGLYLDLTKQELTLHDALLGVPLHNTIYESYNVDVIPANIYNEKAVDIFALKKLIEKFKPRYDYIIIDSSPNYEELRPVIAAADRVFIVTSPDHVTLETSMKAARLARSENTPIEGIVVNKIRLPKHEYNLSEIEKISEIPVVARIKDSRDMAEALHRKMPITIMDDKNVVSKEIWRLASAICGESEAKITFMERFKFMSHAFGRERVNRDFMRVSFYEKQFA
jgi:MinD-like ATPase involved in chromosome partitioning or flagellar assembly